MGPTVLLYNLGEESTAIAVVCSQMGLRCRQVPGMEQGQTLAAVLGLMPPGGSLGTVGGAMLVFWATPPEKMEAFLTQLRQQGLGLGALKAVATATNLNWPGPKLFTELRREHRAMGGRF